MDSKLIFSGPDHLENWFYNKYYTGNARYPTTQLALNLLNQRASNPRIIETGCQRMKDDLGAGMSSSIFAEYVARYGGELIVIDNNEPHLERAREYLQEWPDANIEFILDDSVSALLQQKPCDLLYLDSWDYPIGNNVTLEAQLASQRHCVKEYKAMLPYESNTILLIDDNQLDGGGKPGLVKPILIEDGWICLLDLQQTLWVRSI